MYRTGYHSPVRVQEGLAGQQRLEAGGERGQEREAARHDLQQLGLNTHGLGTEDGVNVDLAAAGGHSPGPLLGGAGLRGCGGCSSHLEITGNRMDK